MSTKTTPPATDISDLPTPSAEDKAPSLDDDEGEEQQSDLPDDVRAQIDRCKAWQDKRNALKPGAPPSSAYYVEACGEQLVLCAPTLDQWERLIKTSVNPEQKHKAGRQLVADTLFWIKGQEKAGPAGALEHLKKVSGYGGVKVMIFDRAAAGLMDQLSSQAGDDVVKKF